MLYSIIGCVKQGGTKYPYIMFNPCLISCDAGHRNTHVPCNTSRTTAGGNTPGAGGNTPGAGGNTPGAGGNTPGAGAGGRDASSLLPNGEHDGEAAIGV